MTIGDEPHTHGDGAGAGPAPAADAEDRQDDEVVDAEVLDEVPDEGLSGDGGPDVARGPRRAGAVTCRGA